MSESSPKEKEESSVPVQEMECPEKESGSAEKPESVEETAEVVTEPREDTDNKEQTKEKDGSAGAKKKRKRDKQKKREKVVITEEDFGPLVDFTKKVGFVYDPEKAEFNIDEVRFERRPWVIPDVRSVLYLRRLERRHNKLVHGLASVRQLTPKQILKEESAIASNL